MHLAICTHYLTHWGKPERLTLEHRDCVVFSAQKMAGLPHTTVRFVGCFKPDDTWENCIKSLQVCTQHSKNSI